MKEIIKRIINWIKRILGMATNIPLEKIEGDLAVGRNLTTGGDATVRGSATIDHDMTVKGWLEARNIRGPQKGMYKSAGALQAAYPQPEPGWWAIVGTELPGALWVAEPGPDGKTAWVATGGSSGLPSVTFPESGGCNCDGSGGGGTTVTPAENPLPVITLEEMEGMTMQDAMKAIRPDLGKVAGWGNAFEVTKNSMGVGLLVMLSESAVMKQITQVFISHYVIPTKGEALGAEEDTQVSVMARTMGLTSGEWGPWRNALLDTLPKASATETGLMKPEQSISLLNTEKAARALMQYTGMPTNEPGDWTGKSLADMMKAVMRVTGVTEDRLADDYGLQDTLIELVKRLGTGTGTETSAKTVLEMQADIALLKGSRVIPFYEMVEEGEEYEQGNEEGVDKPGEEAKLVYYPQYRALMLRIGGKLYSQWDCKGYGSYDSATGFVKPEVGHLYLYVNPDGDDALYTAKAWRPPGVGGTRPVMQLQKMTFS